MALEARLGDAAAVWRQVVALAALLACGCGGPSQEPRGDGAPPSGPEQTFVNLMLRESAGGRLEWELRASRATRSRAGGPTSMDSLRVDFYEGRPEVRSVLVSDSGRVDLQKGILIAMGHVVVTTTEGHRLETEELFWDRKNAKVRSDTFVRLTRG